MLNFIPLSPSSSPKTRPDSGQPSYFNIHIDEHRAPDPAITSAVRKSMANKSLLSSGKGGPNWVSQNLDNSDENALTSSHSLHAQQLGQNPLDLMEKSGKKSQFLRNCHSHELDESIGDVSPMITGSNHDELSDNL